MGVSCIWNMNGTLMRAKRCDSNNCVGLHASGNLIFRALHALWCHSTCRDIQPMALQCHGAALNNLRALSNSMLQHLVLRCCTL